MKVIDIIEHLKTRQMAELLGANQLPGVDYWAIGLYMENKVDKDADRLFSYWINDA